jgi:serine protease Do
MITNVPTVAQHSEKQGPSSDDSAETLPFGFKGSPFGDLFQNPEFRHYFKEMPETPDMPGHRMAGAGSGVIVDPAGVILTNNHVVSGGGQITVRLQDGREFKAFDIKADPKTDLAVLRVKGAGTLPAARLGNSAQVDVGDWVLALGEPFGLEGTVTAGIVSAKGRGIGITAREDFIQTDAAINPGNSGGPLVNLDGEVIGINTAISSSSGGYQGVGFAIPIDLAKWVGGQLETAGHVQRAYLGVVIQPVTQPLAEQFKVKVHEGVLVTELLPNSPAAKAGLKSGDIILDFAGKKVTSPRELQGMVEMAHAGSSQALTVLRDGKRITLQIACAEQPANFGLARNDSHEPANAEPSRFDKLGIQAENLTPQLAEQLGVKAEHGVVITDVHSGSPADLAGLAEGMVITQADRKPVKTVDELRSVLGKQPLQQGVLLLVRSKEGARFVVIRVEG